MVLFVYHVPSPLNTAAVKGGSTCCITLESEDDILTTSKIMKGAQHYVPDTTLYYTTQGGSNF